MTTTPTKLTLAALAALTLSTSFADAAGGGFIGNMPMVNIPVVNVPQGNGNNGNGNNPPVIKIIDIWGHNDTPSTDNSKPVHGLPDVGCKVKDVGVTDDMWIVNTGDVTLPMGVKIRYRVPSTGDHGAFELPRDLAVGQTLKIANLLNGAEPGAPCSVRILA